MTQIWLKRAYVAPGKVDGKRILVDRLWPRGVSKQQLQLDDWSPEVAPSDALRRWYDHDPDKWQEFRSRYRKELDARPNAVHALLTNIGQGRVTLVYGAKNEQYSHARVLKEYLLNALAR